MVQARRMESQDLELRILGAYPSPSETSLDLEWEERNGVSFYIGRSKDGVQEFEISDRLSVYYYGEWVDARCSF